MKLFKRKSQKPYDKAIKESDLEASPQKHLPKIIDTGKRDSGTKQGAIIMTGCTFEDVGTIYEGPIDSIEVIKEGKLSNTEDGKIVLTGVDLRINNGTKKE